MASRQLPIETKSNKLSHPHPYAPRLATQARQSRLATHPPKIQIQPLNTRPTIPGDNHADAPTQTTPKSRATSPTCSIATSLRQTTHLGTPIPPTLHSRS